MTTTTLFPRATGTYFIPDATLFLCATMRVGKLRSLTNRHLYRWIREGLTGRSKLPDERQRRYINFLELTSLRIIAAMRANGIQPADIQIAEARLRDRFNWQFPFTMADFWTSPPDIFMKLGGIPVPVSKNWQSAMDFIMEFVQPVHGLRFGDNGEAALWSPHQGIVLNPEVQFGEPCIEGTRVPTKVIWSFSRSGDSLDYLALMYGLPKSRLEDAIGWEKRLQTAIG